ncbi:MAG: ABC transporter, permease protein 1 (cluster 5, nickel/peptides/opines), partial [uncultured Thermomicrobiales bacterium]
GRGHGPLADRAGRPRGVDPARRGHGRVRPPPRRRRPAFRSRPTRQRSGRCGGAAAGVRARPAAARAVRRLPGRRRPRRVRGVVAAGAAGASGHAGATAGDAGAGRLGESPLSRGWHPARPWRRGERGRLAGPRDAPRRARRTGSAGLLARHDVDPALRGAAPLAARLRFRRSRLRDAPGHHPCGIPTGDGGPPGPRLDPAGAGSRLCPHRARQGACRVCPAPPPRARERAAADAGVRRVPGGVPARRGGGRRGRLRLPRVGSAGAERGRRSRLTRGPGVRRRRRDAPGGDQPAGRSGGPLARPPAPARPGDRRAIV